MYATNTRNHLFTQRTIDISSSLKHQRNDCFSVPPGQNTHFILNRCQYILAFCLQKKNNNFRLYIFRIWLCLIFNENRSYNIQCIFFVFKVREFPPSPSLWNKQKHVETFRFGELFWIWYKTRGIFVFRFAQKPLNLGLEKKSLGNL